MRQTNTIHPLHPRCAASSSTAKRGVIAMKVPAYGRFKPGGLEGMHRFRIYAVAARGSVLCDCGWNCSPTRTKCRRAFQPLSAQEIAAIEQLTAAVWQDSTFFLLVIDLYLCAYLPLPQCLSQPGHDLQDLRFWDFPISSRFIPQFYLWY